MKIAIVHEFLHTLGGAERVLATLQEAFPDATTIVIVGNKKKIETWNKQKKIIHAYPKVPNFFQSRPQLLLPILPILAENIDLDDYDVVISSSSFMAKGVITNSQAIHICYCHAPTRYLWDERQRAIRERSWMGRRLMKPLQHYLRMWDLQAAQRVDYFIANSKTTQRRIQQYYRAQSSIIYPPVKMQGLTRAESKKKGAYLIVSRLSRYKNIEPVIQTCNKLGRSLHIIGEGKESQHLKRIAGPTITLLGRVTDQKLQQEYREARALMFASDDDFGIVAIEAMSAGAPIIALNKGSGPEIVTNKKTGILFDSPTEEHIRQAILEFEEQEENFRKEEITQHAQKFSNEHFIQQIQDFVKYARKKGIDFQQKKDYNAHN